VRGRNSGTVSGGRCRRRRRWCRDLRLGSTFCGRAAGAREGTSRASSRKKNFLFSRQLTVPTRSGSSIESSKFNVIRYYFKRLLRASFLWALPAFVSFFSFLLLRRLSFGGHRLLRRRRGSSADQSRGHREACRRRSRGPCAGRS